MLQKKTSKAHQQAKRSVQHRKNCCLYELLFLHLFVLHALFTTISIYFSRAGFVVVHLPLGLHVGNVLVSVLFAASRSLSDVFYLFAVVINNEAKRNRDGASAQRTEQITKNNEFSITWK